jgi:hypothetical protein
LPIKKSWRLVVLGAAITASLVSAGPASAVTAPTPPAVAPLEEGSCAHPELSQALSIFGDVNNYALAPGGAFDDPTGWQLAKGASIVQGIQPDGTTGPVLDLPGKSMATSPPMCITSEYPMARLWSRTVAGNDVISFNVQYWDRTAGTWTNPRDNGQFAGMYYWDQGFQWSSYRDWATAMAAYANSQYGQWMKNQGYVDGFRAGWRLSPEMAVTPSVDPGWQQVRFTFLAGGDPKKSRYQVDDFRVDPRASR